MPNYFAKLNSPKTHCPNGHEYNWKNTYINPSGARDCRECDRIRWHKRKKKL